MNFDEQCYLDDPYRTEFSSRVREVEPAGEGLSAVYLDRTFFYPDRAGSPTTGDARRARRRRRREARACGISWRGSSSRRGGRGAIDWARRFDHMQQHSGQHLLSRVFLESCKLKTVSFHLGEEICTIDLEGMTPRSEERLEEAEARANEIVFRNSSDRVPRRRRAGARCEPSARAALEAARRGRAGADRRDRGIRQLHVLRHARSLDGRDRHRQDSRHGEGQGERPRRVHLRRPGGEGLRREAQAARLRDRGGASRPTGGRCRGSSGSSATRRGS